VDEVVYTPAELAHRWKLSEQSIRRLFRDVPGVFVMSNNSRRKREYVTLRIPASVAERVWQWHIQK
jgi:hypothetical protein